MTTDVGVADAFTDSMASALRRRGITMRYGLATPRFVLQGLKYPNLTTLRPGYEGSEAEEWASFAFGSHFAGSVGIYSSAPASDSGYMGPTILAVLSNGPVGIRDSSGDGFAGNIRWATRRDGVIVKPDRPLVPTDTTYLNESAKTGKPFETSTWTDHAGLRTHYFFAFSRSETDRTYRLRLRDHGITRRTYLRDLGTIQGRFVEPDDVSELTIGRDGFVYQMAAPISQTGVVMLGNLYHIVPTGKQRIASMDDRPEGLRVRVTFGKGERKLRLDGVSERKPKLRVLGGGAVTSWWERETGKFVLLIVSNKNGTAEFDIDGRAR